MTPAFRCDKCENDNQRCPSCEEDAQGYMESKHDTDRENQP